jgi:hypothetical protein
MAHPSPANANSEPTQARRQVRIMTATVILPVDNVDLTDLVGLPEPAARILLKPPSEHPGMVDGVWDLLVVPPEIDPAIAARLMATAASAGNRQTASSLITAASAPAAWNRPRNFEH